MSVTEHESELLSTFVTLADTMVADYDVIELLQMLVERCVELFDAAAAGIVLVASTAEFEVVASSSERSRLVGLMQLRAGEGPCVEAVTTGRVVSVENVAEIRDRWPLFAEASRESGYNSIHAIPLRLRESTIGSLNLFRHDPGELNEADATAAQALASVATIGILQERSHREENIARGQLQHALDSRVLIEQAKGVLAQTRSIDMDEAFGMIRQYARSHQRRLVDISEEIATRTLII